MAPYTRLTRRMHSAVRTLHYELISAIFVRAVSGEENVKNGQEQLISIMLVCRQWRSIALDTPRLWRRVAFDLVGDILEEKTIIKNCMLWFSRVKTLPLSVDIFFRATVLSQGKYLFPSDKLWEYLASVNQLNRIRLYAPTISCIGDWYNRSWSNQQHLVINACLEVETTLGRGDRCAHDNDVWVAQQMSLLKFASSTSSSPRPNSLTTLSLHARVSSTFVLLLLEESPLLQTCDIDMEQSNFRPWELFAMNWTTLRGDVNVVLPELRVLKIANVMKDQNELASFLRAPNLRRLQLSNYCADLVLFLGTCVAGSKLTLEQLDLRVLAISDSELLDIIRDYPNLNILALDCIAHLSGSFLDDLQLDENRSLMSKIRTLDIKGKWDDFDDLALVRFIKCRGTSWKRRASAEETRTLEWASFEDRRTPKLYVRYDALWPKTKLMRTVMVGKED